jgi:hypothetical protein
MKIPPFELLLQRHISRRRWLTVSAGSSVAASVPAWLSRLAMGADAGAAPSRPQRSCVLLWMNGGPSQTDTFDMKPGHAHGGPFKPIPTSVPGISICEHLPRVAKWMDRLAVIRSMSTREGDHARARDHMRTGYLPQGPIQFPVLGSVVSGEHASRQAELPNYISILPQGLFRAGIPPAGFLGPDHAPLVVGSGRNGADGTTRLGVDHASLPAGVSSPQAAERRALLREMERGFLDAHPGAAANGHRTAYTKAWRLMSPAAREAFAFEDEPPALREQYGQSAFGQGCLLARRLIERGVPFVEVTLGGWDTHADNFTDVERLCGTLDPAWSSLMEDLQNRGLLDSTHIVWMGEFGRTPGINPRAGRDHYPQAWSVVLGGGGIQGGQVVGRTTADGLAVEDRPVSTPDLLATIYLALGLDPTKQNMSNVDRPIRLADPVAKPVLEVLS